MYLVRSVVRPSIMQTSIAFFVPITHSIFCCVPIKEHQLYVNQIAYHHKLHYNSLHTLLYIDGKSAKQCQNLNNTPSHNITHMQSYTVYQIMILLHFIHIDGRTSCYWTVVTFLYEHSLYFDSKHVLA